MLRSTARGARCLALATTSARVGGRLRSPLTIRCFNSTLHGEGSDSPRRSLWEKKVVAALRTYKEKHGHLLVPRSFVVPSDDTNWPSIAWGYQLGCTVSDLRSRLNGCSSPAHSKNLEEELEAMVFAPAASQFKWDTIIMPSLRRYYEVYGHTDVHFRFVVPSGDGTWPTEAWGQQLGNTVNGIRHTGRYRIQVEESEEELERLDFCYKTTLAERDWTEKILPSLEVFRQEFGHCLVKRTFKVPEDPKWPRKAWGVNLGMVVNSIRRRANYSKQAARDKDRLEAIDFAWNHQAEMWNGRIMPAIEVFGAMYPHRNVPPKFVVPPEEPWPRSAWMMRLGKTLGSMRSYGNYFAFYGRDIQKLDELGLNLKLSSRAWQTRVAPLLDIYLTTTQARVPEDLVIPSEAPWPNEMWA